MYLLTEKKSNNNILLQNKSFNLDKILQVQIDN